MGADNVSTSGSSSGFNGRMALAAAAMAAVAPAIHAATAMAVVAAAIHVDAAGANYTANGIPAADAGEIGSDREAGGAGEGGEAIGAGEGGGAGED